MKLTIVFLTAAFLNVSASGRSQIVSLSGKDVPLIRVFAEVEKQTGYVIIYAKNALAGTHSVSIQMKNTPLAEFLQKVLADQPIKYTIDYKTILLSLVLGFRFGSGKVLYLCQNHQFFTQNRGDLIGELLKNAI